MSGAKKQRREEREKGGKLVGGGQYVEECVWGVAEDNGVRNSGR